jgi:hypothetical protein
MLLWQLHRKWFDGIDNRVMHHGLCCQLESVLWWASLAEHVPKEQHCSILFIHAIKCIDQLNDVWPAC